MNRETIVNFLNTYNYEYSENEQVVSVELEFNQLVFIEFKLNHQIEITDKLIGWNFLTGLFEMSFKKAVRYNMIGAVIAPIVIILVACFLETDLLFVLIFSGLLIITLFYMLFFLVFYHTQLENFKTRIMSLSD